MEEVVLVVNVTDELDKELLTAEHKAVSLNKINGWADEALITEERLFPLNIIDG